jgi:vacuolar protein sorting-associated protein IST1
LTHRKEPEPAIAEACAAIIHAAPRVELRELHVLREMLISRYGREYSEAVTENKGGSVVSTRITSRMAAQTPGEELVDM